MGALDIFPRLAGFLQKLDPILSSIEELLTAEPSGALLVRSKPFSASALKLSYEFVFIPWKGITSKSAQRLVLNKHQILSDGAGLDAP